MILGLIFVTAGFLMLLSISTRDIRERLYESKQHRRRGSRRRKERRLYIMILGIGLLFVALGGFLIFFREGGDVVAPQDVNEGINLTS
jgi:ABC-type Fe3+ transport system permease subunit